MAEHVIKVAAPYYGALANGDKTFEVRRNDRAYQRGDTLVLLDMSKCQCTDENCDRRPPPIRKTVSYVYAGDPRFGGHGGLAPGHVVLGLAAAVSGTREDGQ